MSRAWTFVAFPLAIVFVFSVVPSIASVGLSFFELDSEGAFRFVGLENYRVMGTRDPRILAALRNSLLFAAGAVPLQVLLGFLVAAALDARWFVGRTLCRTLVFLPTVVSVVAVGYVWRWVLDSEAGLLTPFLRGTGLGAALFPGGIPVWLGDTPWVLVSLLAIHVWRGLGFATVLYLAALGQIPRSLYEAASLDGASGWQSTWIVTWPGVRATTTFLLVTGFIGALQVFDLVWVMTEGSGEWSTVLNVQLYREFSANRLGYAAAIGVVVLVLSGVATWIQLRFRR